MVRIFAVTFVLSCLVAPTAAQIPPASPATAAPAATPAAKPAVKKVAPKAKIAAKPSPPVDGAPCRIGVISTIGDSFVVKKVGLLVFGNEETEVPIDAWGLDDLVVARVRAAAPGAMVRKIAYAKGAFNPWYHGHGSGFFNNPGQNLTAVVRPVAATANCERYIVVLKSSGPLAGTNQTLDGIGVNTNWANGIVKQGLLFVYIQVTVFDGSTFAIREDPFGNIGARLAASLSRLTKDDNLRSLPGFASPTSPESVVSNATLRDGAREMLAAQLDQKLPAYLKEE